MNYFDVLLAKKLEDDRDPKVEGLSVTENGRYHEDGVVYDPVIVNVPETPLSKLTVTENGTYTAPSGTAYSEVDVDVPLPENAYLLKEIEDVEIASFNDGSDLSMPKLEVAIEPVQEGSGAPSPENIRPISGWDEINVNVSGVNVWDEEWELGGISNTTGQNTTNNSTIRTKNYIPVVPNTQYYINSNKWQFVSGYDADKNFVGTVPYASSGTGYYINVPSNVHYIRIPFSTTYGTTYNNDISINYPSTDTEYHAYNGHTYTIDLDGTRYGGKVDLVSGVLTVDRVRVDLSSVSFTYDSNNKRWNRQFSDMKNYSARSADLMFEQYQATTSAYTGDTGTAFAYGKDIYIYDANQSLTISGKCIYELATPLTIQLTPTVVKSLRGKNNVYADSGNILDLSYLAKEE